MSSEKKSRKKQSSHNPEADVVPPSATDPSGPAEPVRSEETTAPPVLEAVTFTGVDPAAWAWLNRWPFLDDTAATAGTDEETEPGSVEPDQVAEPTTTVDEDMPVPVLPLADFRAWSEEPVSSLSPRTRQVAGIAAVVVAAVVVAGALVWVAAGRDTEEVVVRAHSAAHAAPVPLPPGTSFVRSRVLPSGGLEVTHWIHARLAVASLTIRTPRTLGLAPGSVSASHFFLATDGTPYPAVSTHEGHPGTQTFRFPMANTVYLRYRLAGAVQLSSPDGRALARITSLEVTTDATIASTTQRVVGARVLALACSAPSATAVPQPCGVENDGSWSVALDRTERHERVMAQLDLSCGSRPVSSSRCAAPRSAPGRARPGLRPHPQGA
jgi:hypothetical protein